MSRPLLTSYQRFLASDPHPFVAADKARRIGGSFGVAHRAALRGMGLEVRDGKLLERAGGSVPQKLISASQEQANELLAEAYQHVEAIARVYPDERVRPLGDPAKTKFRLRNGTTFRALPDNPRTARGGEGDVTLDEFAFSRDALAMWRAVKAITDPNLGNPQGYRLSVITTPLAEGSLAHRICRGDRSKRDEFRHFSRYHIDIYSAVRRGFPNPAWSAEQRAAFIDRMRREAGDPDTFAQEYECSWLAANAAFIPLETIHAARYEPDELPIRGPLFGGLDVGRHKHLSALARVLKDERNRTLWVLPFREADIMRRKPYEEQQAYALAFVKGENARRLCIDETGLGGPPTEWIKKRAPSRVEGVTFTNQVKSDLATALKMAIEGGGEGDDGWKLRIPFDRDLIFDLASLRKIVTAAGNIRYDADDSSGSHADRAWAVALAVHAATAPKTVVRSLKVKGI